MQKIAVATGTIAGLGSILLWIVLVFFNPYSAVNEFDAVLNTFFMLMIPPGLALVAVNLQKKLLMLLAFGWSLYLNIYFATPPGIFA